MPIKNKFVIFLAFSAVIFALLYSIRSILSPFIVSIILAYLLSPLADVLHKKYKVSRTISTLLILTLFITFTSLICSYILPIMYVQFVNFINVIPSYFNIIHYELYPKLLSYIEQSNFANSADISAILKSQDLTTNMISFSKDIFNEALNSSFSLINTFSIVFITPIMTFYLIKDWNIMLKTIDKHLPKKSAKEIKKVVINIDKTLSQYLRGQLNICILLGLFYATLLNFSGLNFGFLIGFLTGIFSFVPYIGMLVGVAIGITVALFQWGLDPINISTIAGIFILGQFIEGNFVTPKVIGDKIGIHPVWIIFGLFFFGFAFGVGGVIIAVPLTATFGVIIKHFAQEYRKKYT